MHARVPTSTCVHSCVSEQAHCSVAMAPAEAQALLLLRPAIAIDCIGEPSGDALWPPPSRSPSSAEASAYDAGGPSPQTWKCNVQPGRERPGWPLLTPRPSNALSLRAGVAAGFGHGSQEIPWAIIECAFRCVRLHRCVARVSMGLKCLSFQTGSCPLDYSLNHILRQHSHLTA